MKGTLCDLRIQTSHVDCRLLPRLVSHYVGGLVYNSKEIWCLETY